MKNIEKKIAKIYIFLLPITCVSILEQYLNGVAYSIAYIFNFIGLGVLLIKNKGIYIKKNSIMMRYIIFMCFILNLSSIIMSIVLNDKLGILFGRNTYVAIFPHLIYYIQITLAIYYNYYIFNKFGFEFVKDIIYKSIIFVLIIGYIQLIIIFLNNDNVYILYENFEKMFNIKSLFVISKRIALTTREASMAGSLISIYIFPFLFSDVLVNKNIKSGIIALLFFPLIYFSKSSSAYFGVFVILFYLIFKLFIKFKKQVIVIGYSMMIIIMCIVFIKTLTTSKDFKNKKVDANSIQYIIKDKLYDKNNTSTVHRSSSIYTSFEALKQYPILGVGNGNQGFFYIRNFPQWAFNSSESTAYYYGFNGWPGSGAFWPTYLSSYGVLGIILLFIFILVSNKRIKRLKIKNEFIYYFYNIGSLGFFVMAIFTLNIEVVYYLIFILSLPLLGEKYE